uniref:Endoglucanase E1 n=1 Tax=Aegilops tauschii TaxID=37682 RepID=M8B8X6_AEGTA
MATTGRVRRSPLLAAWLALGLAWHCALHHAPAAAVTLSTASRWVVDEAGDRVKLACVNWPSHLEPMLAEGLGKRPVGAIAGDVAAMGFNCVRLTWPTFLVTNASYSSLTVEQSFQRLNLTESLAGIRANNPAVAVVSSLGENNVMVILDNHVSKPGWCCDNTDGNGFFGDGYFEPDVWVDGLTKMATMFAGVPHVVGMSLRNELRGPRQNSNDWYKYMQRGAEAVHAANPRVLVILSGLSFDNDLAFLNSRQVSLSFARKAAFEVHWYSFSNGQEWAAGSPNEGSYYLRQGVLDLDEVYGVLDRAWSRPRNDTALRRVQPLQRPLRGPGYAEAAPYTVLFHPATGLCVLRRSLTQPLELGACADTEAWEYAPQQGRLALRDSPLMCLRAQGAGRPVRLGTPCDDDMSRWRLVSDSKLHVAVNTSSSSSSGSGSGMLCLDVGADGQSVVTNPCRCLSADNSCDPESQWFKLVSSTRSVAANGMLAELPVKLGSSKIRSL